MDTAKTYSLTVYCFLQVRLRFYAKNINPNFRIETKKKKTVFFFEKNTGLLILKVFLFEFRMKQLSYQDLSDICSFDNFSFNTIREYLFICKIDHFFLSLDKNESSYFVSILVF